MPDRFDLTGDGETMMAVVTTGNGGYDKLDYRAVPVPTPGPGEVLVQVLAAGMNNTEINTRLGWYSSSVTAGTEYAGSDQDGSQAQPTDGGWNEATPFPFIQGTDCCGRVVTAGPDGNTSLINKRVLVRACMRPAGFQSPDNVWMGSDFDGAFAQYVKVPGDDVFPIECSWSDEELATIPCAYGTSENMIHRAGVTADDHVLVAGASGGVGSATVQLAKRRGAKVTAVAGKDKMEQVSALGADQVIARGDNLIEALGEEAVDVVIDNVAGDDFGDRLRVLKRSGRYASSGAIAGPIVMMDMRTFYLKDLTLIGCTGWDKPVFPNLVSYIEKGEIQPLLAATFPLEKIADAQRIFLKKQYVGNFVLVPPQPDQ